MRISELVDKLNDLKKKYGDIQVISCPSSEYWTDDLNIENIDCYVDTKDSSGNQAVKIYGYV